MSWRLDLASRYPRDSHLLPAIETSLPQSDPLLPLETEPLAIQELWKQVRTDLAMSASSGKRSKLPVGRSVASRQISEQEGSAVSSAEYSQSGTVQTSVSRNPAKPSPGHRDFRTDILLPRGIAIISAEEVSVWEHFGTQELDPEVNRAAHYNELLHAQSRVWIPTEASLSEEIALEYRCMTEAHECEAEFASYAKETILRRDPRTLLHSYGANRRWVVARKLELVAKPDESLRWYKPPVITPSTRAELYEFDLRPDCAYWLSVQAFNSKYTSYIKHKVYVVNSRITCPYFFVEFKKDGEQPEEVQNQVAAVSAMALFNRYNLRVASQQKSKQPMKELEMDDLRVYGLTLVGACFKVWCVKPRLNRLSKQWEGCEMVTVGFGECTNDLDVLLLIDWINEIHCWGIGVHGKSCEKDLKKCLQGTTAASRVSDIFSGTE